MTQNPRKELSLLRKSEFDLSDTIRLIEDYFLKSTIDRFCQGL
jgi:hypothetical protein